MFFFLILFLSIKTLIAVEDSVALNSRNLIWLSAQKTFLFRIKKWLFRNFKLLINIILVYWIYICLCFFCFCLLFHCKHVCTFLRTLSYHTQTLYSVTWGTILNTITENDELNRNNTQTLYSVTWGTILNTIQKMTN